MVEENKNISIIGEDQKSSAGCISDVAAACQLDGAYQDALLSVDIRLDGSNMDENTSLTVRWYLSEPGKPDIIASSSPESITFDGRSNPVSYSEVTIVEPHLWSAESPFLYSLRIEAVDMDGNVVDVKSMAWGFRQFDILFGERGGKLTLNGQPVKLKGVNQVNFDFTDSQSLCSLKQLNVDTIYCTDDSLTDDILEAADRVGMYLFVEVEYERLESMICSFRNHPSVIVWSIQSEKRDENSYLEMKKAVNEYDVSRFIHFQGDDEGLVSDIVFYSDHPPQKINAAPVLLWIEAETLRKGVGNLMEQVNERLNIAGILFRNFADPLRRTSETDELKAVFSPISAQPLDLENGSILLKNRHYFIDLSGYEINWNLQRVGNIVASGQVRQPTIAPGNEQKIALFREIGAFPGKGEGFITLFLCLKEENVWGNSGYEIARMQMPVPETSLIRLAYPRISNSDTIIPDPLSSTEDIVDEPQICPWQHRISGNSLLLVRKKVGMRINLVNGVLETVDFGVENMLTMGIVPGEDMRQDLKLTRYKVKNYGDDLELQCKIKGPSRVLQQNMRYLADGRVLFSNKSSGVSFGLRQRYQYLSWYGSGPSTISSTEQKSALVEVYSMNTGDFSPDESRRQIGVRWMKFSDGGNSVMFHAENSLLNFTCTGSSDSRNLQVHINNMESSSRTELKFIISFELADNTVHKF